MRIAIITNSSSYEPRVFLAADFFKNQGHEVVIILSDFIHREKMKRNTGNRDIVYINTIPYYRNLSIRRIYSHLKFSKEVYKILVHMDLDMLYVLIPANSLLKYSSLYKKRTNIILLVDILDLWPESLPIPIMKKIWPFSYWADLRNKNLKYADLVITECKLFQNRLSPYLTDCKVMNIYWPRLEEKQKAIISEKINDELCFCYLGSINHILDINFLVELLSCIKMRRKITLHIIGDGEKKDELIAKLKEAQIDTIYYGIVYDESKKMDILSLCHYGLNIMKPSVCVGVTMKSVDYVYAGLSLINNIKGDTWELIEKYDIGYNCDYKTISSVAKIICDKHISNDEMLRVRKCYLDNFSKQAYRNSMDQCMKTILTLQET